LLVERTPFPDPLPLIAVAYPMHPSVIKTGDDDANSGKTVPPALNIGARPIPILSQRYDQSGVIW